MRISDCIAASHPALAGHFPGDPVVPGALLLARVARAAAKLADAPLAGVPAVKFHAPLRPGERFEVELARSAGALVEFRVLRGDTKIASGSLRFGDRDAA
jgi:3-hydroxymyristoyl/3-hydroxydecanoyl-(acyl carrier protein) dehydratase